MVSERAAAGSMSELERGHGYYRPSRSGHARFTRADHETDLDQPQQSRRRMPSHPALSGRGRGGYAKIIGAEYLATNLIILGLLVTGTKKETRVQTLARFTATSLVFALLALLATGPRSGRVAAAFGALVLTVAVLDAATEIETIADAIDPPPPNVGGAAGAGTFGGFLNPPNSGGGGGSATQRIQAV